MPHVDGGLYYPTVTTISLGTHTFLDFYKPVSDAEMVNLEERFMFSLLVEPRSLLILKEDMYNVYLHGIKEITEDLVKSNLISNYPNLGCVYTDCSVLQRDTRVSLTIRHVPKVLKINPNSLFNRK